MIRVNNIFRSHELAQAGAQAVILGCTEIALLVKQGDTAMPLYDTTAIHAQARCEFAPAGIDD